MLDLVTLPDERLFLKSSPVVEFNDKIRDLAIAMIDTMHHARGVGLAGVQVGFMERIFVVHVDDDAPRVFINPRISRFSDQIVPYEEGCLSIPGIYSMVDRPDALRIEALNEEGNPFELEVDGFLARVIQHEFDHLEGRLFYQHLSDRRQDRFLRSYEKLHNVVL